MPVVAGLADQHVLVVEAGEGGQAQLLIVAFQGDALGQGGVVQGLDQGDAGGQVQLTGAAAQ